MSGPSPATRKRSRLTGKIIPRCHCGKAVYAGGKCYGHYQSRPAAVLDESLPKFSKLFEREAI